MAGLQMPKRGNGAAMLRELRDEERPSRENTPMEAMSPEAVSLAVQEQTTDGHTSVLTEARTYGSTEARKDVSDEVSKDALTDAGTGGSTGISPQARKPVRKPVRADASMEGRTQVSEDAPTGFLEAVDAALASREPLIGGVKATVDMSPELSTRSKRYLADHRGQNTRQVLIALFDAFLSAKGY